jgi:hypothetical protein
VDDLRPADIEALEEISRDELTRTLFLRLAALQRAGALPSFLFALERDPDVEDDVKGSLVEIALDGELLQAVEEYCRRTERLH